MSDFSLILLIYVVPFILLFMFLFALFYPFNKTRNRIILLSLVVVLFALRIYIATL